MELENERISKKRKEGGEKMRKIGRFIISMALGMIVLAFLFGMTSSLLAVWFVW